MCALREVLMPTNSSRLPPLLLLLLLLLVLFLLQGILSPRMFTMMILMAIVTTCITAPGNTQMA